MRINTNVSMTIVAFGAKHRLINIMATNQLATTVDPMRFPEQATSSPPNSAPPRYPAGMMRHRHPPVYFVTPPSFIWTFIACESRNRLDYIV